MKKSAFTLVELMVAMAIIGVLLGLAVFGVSAAQMAQRNTERKAALQDINLGIQQYLDANQTYPSSIFFDATSAYVGGSSADCLTAVIPCKKVPLKGAAKPSTTGELISGGLTQETNGSGTKYVFMATCTGGYYLAACVENSNKLFEVGTCTEPQTTVTCQ